MLVTWQKSAVGKLRGNKKAKFSCNLENTLGLSQLAIMILDHVTVFC